ncbi:hypothetical protein C0J45_7946 [Silurus meridionalis]|nr:hypothetical protein C0J45_7946 [Silurus meridionalis]
MAKTIIPCIIINILKAAVIFSLTVQQTPQHLITPDKSEAKIKCWHGDTTYLYMNWYQQKTNSDSIELIGLLVNDKFTPEAKFNARFTTSGKSTGDAFLLIASLTPEDNAVYFCAARSTATHPPFLLNKKLYTKHLEIRSVLWLVHHSSYVTAI